ncbi:cytochrome c/FTR1 family iron permease [Xanthomonas campestris pv. campestris]|nr:cytochrome c/FTR1 family iron permease [Xanthomonas campestris pv. campestris]
MLCALDAQLLRTSCLGDVNLICWQRLLPFALNLAESVPMTPRMIFLSLSGWVLTAAFALNAAASEKTVATTWRLLDYIAVDYREAVKDGRVVNEAEYAEMVEFSSTVNQSIKNLSATSQLANLEEGAQALQTAIGNKLPPEKIAAQARELGATLIRAYPIPVGPTTPPNFDRGKEIYAQVCANCHGLSGAGDGPVSSSLDPPPIDFTDRHRAEQRSVFALQQVIEQGLEGTPMISYATLPAEDRWALATYVGSLAYPESLAEAGKRQLEENPGLRQQVDMGTYIGTTPAALAEKLRSNGLAEAVTAYLRRHPEALESPSTSNALSTSKKLLQEALDAYRVGDRKAAQDLALAAYLDGFEPVEPLLAARDSQLMVKIETGMARVRSSMAAAAPAEQVSTYIKDLDGYFSQAEQILGSSESSAITSYLAAFTILLREGLEALLIVIAVIALLRKTERPQMLGWVHAGWTSALLAGAATWALATWVITISGASRELSEGFGSLIAAVVLIWVGIWMHGKAQADAWQRYVREKFGSAVGRSSGFLLMGLVFLVVYREVFETILFYAAIWTQGNELSVIAGGASAAILLVLIGWLMMRYSRRLPISTFFRYSSWMIAVLAVALAGKAVSALQEAGYVPVHLLEGWPRAELLGLYPTSEGVLAQVAALLVIIAGYTLTDRSSRHLGSSQ